MTPRLHWCVLLALLSTSCSTSSVVAQAPAREDAKPQAAGVGKLPFVSFDVKKRQVRMECEALEV